MILYSSENRVNELPVLYSSENIINELPVINKELSEISNCFKANKLSVKGALDKYNIIPQLFPKKFWIFIPLEVLAWVMTAC